MARSMDHGSKYFNVDAFLERAGTPAHFKHAEAIVRTDSNCPDGTVAHHSEQRLFFADRQRRLDADPNES